MRLLCSMETQLPQKKGHSPYPISDPYLSWPNGWMDEDATYYGSRPRPKPHCVRLGPGSSRKSGTAAPPFFGPSLLWTRSPISATAEPFVSQLLAYSAHWRSLANTTELVLPSAHPSPQPNGKLHSSQQKVPILYNGCLFSPKIDPSYGGSGPHVIHDSLGQSECITQSASPSVQPFLHG